MDNLLIFISNAIIQTFLCGYTIYSISKFFKSEEYSKKQIILLFTLSVITVTIILFIKQWSQLASIIISIICYTFIPY